MRFFKKKQPVDSKISVFFRKASAADKKRVFKKAAEESIKMQKEIIRKAEEMERADAKAKAQKSQEAQDAPR